MMNLVTGASGFIGSHLVESLAASGEKIRCFVRPDSDAPHPVSECEVVYGDVRDIKSVRKAVEGVDVIYHLAAVSRFSLNIPKQEYEATNVEGTRNVLEAGRIAGAKKIVYTSTIEAVGPSRDGKPLDEETEAEPRNIYGKTKLEGEKLMKEYYRNYGLSTVIVRPPMTYGPRDPLLLQRLFRIINRGYYAVIGDGKALMEFCYVKNQVLGLRLAAERGKAGETYFISDERSYEMEEVVREIARGFGVDAKIFHLPVSAAWGMGLSLEALSKILRFPPFRVKETGRPPFSRNSLKWLSRSALFCNTSKARRELGYKPPYALREGIEETIQWYRRAGLL